MKKIFQVCIFLTLASALGLSILSFSKTGAASLGNLISPTAGPVTRGYKQFHLDDNFPTHKRIDTKCSLDIASDNQPVRAVADGIVTGIIDSSINYPPDQWELCGPSGIPENPGKQCIPAGQSYGKIVRINHGGVTAIYAHLSSIAQGLTYNSPVTAGQQIGLTGNTGFSTGPHLHFEMSQNGVGYKPEPLCAPDYARCVTNITPNQTTLP